MRSRREVEVKEPDGTTKMRPFGKGRSKRLVPVTRLVAKRDAQGRVVDLHALRTTLGMKLARAGTPPQAAQKIMRHSDYRTTLKYYTDLQVADLATGLALVKMLTTAKPGSADVSASNSPAVRTAVEPAVEPATAILDGSLPCDALRPTSIFDPVPHTNNRSVKPSDSATPCDGILVDAMKQAKGVEPSTFSLEG